jgi:hypothetical protein
MGETGCRDVVDGEPSRVRESCRMQWERGGARMEERLGQIGEIVSL